MNAYNLNEGSLGDLTSGVQIGFIIGTFLFALFTITDRYSPSAIFCVSAIIAALFNLCILFPSNNLYTLLSFRFFTGFFLAGIYPVGMKIASDYFEKGLGKSLSFLVGALVLGTAFPHILKGFQTSLKWQYVIISTSCFAVLGGLIILVFVPKGPYQKLATYFRASKIFMVFKEPKFRAAALGYFGHMWELYAFWTFVPVMLLSYSNLNSIELNISLWSFAIIGIGGFACGLGGFISERFGVKTTAKWALLLSCLCCLLIPFVFLISNTTLLLSFLLFWGMVVIMDSPLFSTLVAQNVDADSKGTALTIVNCIGFSITIISIQMISYLTTTYSTSFVYSTLALGPILGIIALIRPINHSTSKSK